LLLSSRAWRLRFSPHRSLDACRPGLYNVSAVELLLLRTPRGDPHDHRLVNEHTVRAGSASEAREARPVSQACTDVGVSADWFDGYWNTSRQGLPNYVPRGCALDWYADSDVAALAVSPRPKPVWIHVFGNSKERGAYNRLLDLALVRADKVELVNSVTVKVLVQRGPQPLPLTRPAVLRLD